VKRSLRRRLAGLTAALAALATLAVPIVVAPVAAQATPAHTPATRSHETLQRPDEVSARLAAQSTGKDILITDETTPTSLTYARPDGSLRSEVSPVPVRVAQPGGKWSDVDYDLRPSGGGWAPKVSPAKVVFSGGGTGPAVSLDSGARGFDLSWAKSLPAPTISGNNALYRLTDTETLVLSATSDGFEQSLMLSAAPTSAPELRLGFDMTGVDMVANATGGYDFVKTTDKSAVFTMPKPKMYSSQVVDEEHTQEQSVPVKLGTDDDGSPYLDLSAGMPFLTDPATVYPVWIDPSVSSVSRYGDTYVTQADADSHVSDYDLRIGNSTNGNIRRSLVRFDTASSVPAGSHVTSAALNLWNISSNTCAARSLFAYPVTESYTLTGATWANQPSYSTSSAYSASASFSYGNEGLGCPNNTGSINLAGMVQAWVSGTLTDYGLLLKAGSETDSTYAKYFCAMNVDTTAASSCTSSAHYPTLSVVYNTYPGTPTGGTFSPKVSGTTTDSYVKTARVYSTSLTPTFTAKVSNADGAKVALQVKLSHDVNYATEGTGEMTTITSAAVTAGSKANVTVPAGALPATYHVMYQMRSRVTNGAGGFDYSAWTPASLTSTTTSKFALNTAAPQAPSISCGSFPTGVWTVPTATTTSCTFDTAATDGSGYYWGLDDPSTPNLAVDTSNTGAAVAVTVPSKVLGWHTLYVQSRDTALHLSPTTTSYEFGVGAGGVLSPAAGSSTAKGIALSASANSGYSNVTYQWAAGTTSSTWADLPVADVTPAGSSTPIAAWPLAGTLSGGLTNFAGYNWNVASTLAAAGQPDGALRVRAKFATSAGTIGYSAERVFSLAVTTFGQNAATDDLGPGEVSLTTGDFQVSASDAAAGALGVSRTATSLAPAGANTGPTGIFGAGWKAALPVTTFGDSTLIDNSASGSVTIRSAADTEYVYVKQSDGSYLGVGAADDGSKLVKSTSIKNPANPADTTVYTGWQLTDTTGTVTTWLKATSGAWLVTWVDEAGAEGETSYARDAFGRITTILGPIPTGVTCTTTSFNAAGCSALKITYAAATTATGTAESTWGDYSGLASSISWTGYDPASSAVVTKQVAAYLYDSTGHLRATWDPRLSTPLKTRYTYDGAGRLATITPAGLNAWTLTYDTAGRIVSTSRSDPANGTATQTVAYNLPVSGINGAPDVSATAAGSWGQISDLAYTGAAVFPASHVPAAGSNGDYAPGSGDWPYANITYADINGTVVDSAVYGAGAWQIDSARYDENGDEVWSLDAGNRAQALAPTADTDPFVAAQADSAARADLLAETSTYSDDGVDLLGTLGPAHPAELSSGDVASVRVQTSYTYDAGAPTSDAYHLVTKTVTTPVALDGTTVPSDETTTKVTGYDPIDGSSSTGATSGWVLRAPTTQTTWMGTAASSANDLTTKTRYDASGREVESQPPGGTSMLTTYYTTAANSTYAACGGKPYWAGLVCRTDGTLTTSDTYNVNGQPLTKVETSGSVTRTTTNGYDAIGRPTGTTVAVAGLASSTAVPATTIGYSATTGLPVTRTAGSAVLTSTYDALGRRVGYTDADGAPSTFGYTIDGQVASLTDRQTTTYTYGSGTEHRGLITGFSAGLGSSPSNFAATYDAGGKPTTETYPNGLTATYDYDNAGDATDLTYTLPTYSGGTAGTLGFTDVSDAAGQTVLAESALSTQNYSYDNAGRLTQVQDSVDGACTTRSYGFNQQSDRTSLSSYAANDDGTCQATTAASTVTNSFDAADRITNSGYTYDQLGRTLTVPAAGLASGTSALSTAYYDTDMPVSLTQGAAAKAFTLDPAGRYRTEVDTTSGTETMRTVNHYSGSTDSPSWQAVSTDAGSTYTWQRNVPGVDGALAAIQSSDGTTALELTNLHGDVVATLPDQVPTAADQTGASISAYFESTEYGAPRDSSLANRYGWLGAAQRSSETTVASVVLMGQRLYNPATGRFLQTDPVPRGSCNAYDYVCQDPINNLDLDGRSKHNYSGHHWHWWGLELDLTRHRAEGLEIILAGAGSITTIAAALSGIIPGGQLASGLLWALDGLEGYFASRIAWELYRHPSRGVKIKCDWSIYISFSYE
jgi:RHS repeat-associated protein